MAITAFSSVPKIRVSAAERLSSGHTTSMYCRRESMSYHRETGSDPIQGRVFVDVGANVGTTSVPIAIDWKPSKVLSIEPAPHTFDYLRCNVILNNVDHLITCIHAAVTNLTGHVELEITKGSGDSRVRIGESTPGDYGEQERQTVTVPGFTLDEILQNESIALAEIGVVWAGRAGARGTRHVVCARVARLRASHGSSSIGHTDSTEQTASICCTR